MTAVEKSAYWLLLLRWPVKSWKACAYIAMTGRCLGVSIKASSSTSNSPTRAFGSGFASIAARGSVWQLESKTVDRNNNGSRAAIFICDGKRDSFSIAFVFNFVA